MTEIEKMPCVGRIAVETPGYRPCGDCQEIRGAFGVPYCDKAAATARSPDPYPGNRFEEFEAWLVAQGMLAKSAHDLTKGVTRCLDARVFSPGEVTAEHLPGLKESTLGAYRRAFARYERFCFERGLDGHSAPVAPETAEVIPGVVEVIETPTVPQERAESMTSTETFLAAQVIDDEPPWMAAPPDLPPETVLLPIPISWIESVTYHRDGCQVWIDGGDPEELDIDAKTADVIRAALGRRG